MRTFLLQEAITYWKWAVVLQQLSSALSRAPNLMNPLLSCFSVHWRWRIPDLHWKICGALSNYLPGWDLAGDPCTLTTISQLGWGLCHATRTCHNKMSHPNRHMCIWLIWVTLVMFPPNTCCPASKFSPRHEGDSSSFLDEGQKSSQEITGSQRWSQGLRAGCFGLFFFPLFCCFQSDYFLVSSAASSIWILLHHTARSVNIWDCSGTFSSNEKRYWANLCAGRWLGLLTQCRWQWTESSRSASGRTKAR